jgi:uracil phosphoribosyltransferase
MKDVITTVVVALATIALNETTVVVDSFNATTAMAVEAVEEITAVAEEITGEKIVAAKTVAVQAIQVVAEEITGNLEDLPKSVFSEQF